MAFILLLAGVVLERTALAAGFLAAMIAVGGFIARAHAVLGGVEPAELQRPTTNGGLLGLFFGILIVIIDMVAG